MNETTDLILPVLQNIQAQLGELKAHFDHLEARVEARFDGVDERFAVGESRLDTLDGRLAAFAEMTSARFTTIENMLVDLSARTHVLSSRIGKLEA